MRNPTNILLTNLAFADFGVSIFCILQNLSLYLSSEWPLDDFMCKMYHFVQSLSYTCSVLTLVVISIERFLVIVYPLQARKALEKRKLIIALILIWLVSMLICMPRLWMFGTAFIPIGAERMVKVCILKVNIYDPKIYHVVSFVALFLIPITVMIAIYAFICYRLYEREAYFAKNKNGCGKVHLETTLSNGVTVTSFVSAHQDLQEDSTSQQSAPNLRRNRREQRHLTECGNEALTDTRKKVIRLLIALVAVFFVCNFPIHCRKLIQDWYPGYNGASQLAIAITITTNLLMFFNSGLNPLLYALLSQKFRQTMMQIIFCDQTCFN
ncbi:uncharacterized protein B4U79_09554 [Dinothrombium tinctorium]|uniref:G-protein coupled receptors family 1 profile domain-containing protein n=1 Tax=Dinothrombium tinctorium TaxID=1965070 RepID=A0A3S3RT82_9ACAR|nr:uncharacterized protein B4U79_09554 [Dinothrombium tinctorium]